MRRTRLIAVILGVLIGGMAPTRNAGAEGKPVCQGRDQTMVVRVGEHKLYLCEGGNEVRSFAVALGRAGVGKTSAGDKKTPIGSYALGTPRRSEKFHWFVPVAFPTEAQRRAGYSGSAIGIHGPRRKWAWAGRANVWVDWTAGCIAVADDAAIESIVDWVKRRKAGTVVIE